MNPAAERRFVLGTFALGHLANDWAAGSIWLIAPAVAAAMGLGAPEVGLLLTLYGFGAALGYLPAGIVADRVRRRGPLLVATFWWVAAGYLAASFAPGYWTLALLLAIAVMGDAAWHPIATGVLVQRFPGRRAQVLGIHAMGGTIGAEVLAPIGVGLALVWFDWRTALQLSAIPAALMGIAFFSVSRRLGVCDVPATTHGGIGRVLGAWLAGPGRPLLLVTVLYNMSTIALLSMTPLFLQRDLGRTPLESGVVFALMLLLGSVLQPVAGRLSDLVGRKPVLVPGIVAGGGLALIAGLVSPGWVTVTALVLSVALLTAVRSVVLAAAVELARGREATTLAVAFTLMDGVGAAGAVLAGLAGAQTLTHAFVFGALLAGLAAAAAFRLPGEGVPEGGAALSGAVPVAADRGRLTPSGD